MKNLIFRKNTISEFDFLKESNNMLTSGTVIEIDALGSLIPLNLGLIENLNIHGRFCQKKIFFKPY